MNQISLLFSPDVPQRTAKLDEKVLYHFSLDRTFAGICPDMKRRDVFLKTLRALPYDEEHIRYRQDVLKDLCKSSSFFEQFAALAAKFEELRAAQSVTEREYFRQNAHSSQKTKSGGVMILVQQANTFKLALQSVKSFGELLRGRTNKSRGLLLFEEACRNIFMNPAYNELQAICEQYEKVSPDNEMCFRFAVGPNGRLSAYEITDPTKVEIDDPEYRRGFSFKKLFGSRDSGLSEKLFVRDNDYYEALAYDALTQITNLFRAASNEIFDAFGTIQAELDFYSTAIRYTEVLTENHVPCNYPGFTQNGDYYVKSLYDLFLSVATTEAHNVVPNGFDLVPEKKGLLVFGENGTGKTVFLRSIGTMQILAQAGLPVPAESAFVPVCTQVSTQFSEAEKEFEAGNDAGRFEQEVRELAKMVDTLKEGAAVFLNETFQSTAYSEGANGLYDLLEYFSDHKIRWVLVSHLHDLETKFTDGEVSILHTHPGFHIE